MTAIAPGSRSAADIDADELLRRNTPLRRALDFFRRKPLGTLGLAIVLVFAFAGAFAELIAPFDPEENDFNAMMMAPSLVHFLGTDQFGRDIFSRLVFGARTAMIVGFGAAVGGGLIGLVLGVSSAYFGGWFDLVLQRVFDILMAFPLIILALAVVSVFGTGVENVIIAITIPLVPRCGRVVRASALAVREVPYVDAARALGLQPRPHRAPSHDAQRAGAVPDPAFRLRRPGDPGRGVAVLSRPWRAGAGRRLGPDAAGRRRGLRNDGAVDRHLPRSRHRADGARASACSATPCATPSIPSCATADRSSPPPSYGGGAP